MNHKMLPVLDRVHCCLNITYTDFFRKFSFVKNTVNYLLADKTLKAFVFMKDNSCFFIGSISALPACKSTSGSSKPDLTRFYNISICLYQPQAEV